MNTLRCELPDITLTKPRGLDSSLFFKVYYGPNAIAFAQLSSRAVNDYSRKRSGYSEYNDKAPGVSYCLKNIEVSQNYRNRGIGTALLEEVISFCKDERVSILYGEAKGEIEALRRWYEEIGFELDDVDNIQLSFAA